MSAQFDATARINVDLRGFRTASEQVLKSGGEMQKTFHALHSALEQVDRIDKTVAEDLSRTMKVYTQVTGAVKSYVQAVELLVKNDQKLASGTEHMTGAFTQLREAMAGIQGLSQKEAERIGRTVTLYQQMAAALKTVAEAQTAMLAISRNAETADRKQAETVERLRLKEQELGLAQQRMALQAEQAAQRQEIAQQRLLLQQDKAAQKAELNAQKQAAAEERLVLARQRAAAAAEAAARQQETAQQRLAVSQQRNAIAEQEAANAAQRLVVQQQRLALAQQETAARMDGSTRSSIALRSALGELEGQGQQLVQAMARIGTTILGAAISQEAAFAQVKRVLGLTKEEAANLQDQFERIALSYPVSPEEVALIGQLGAQIGVTKQELGTFTETVAAFSLTTGISAEQTTLLLGRITEMQDLPITEVRNLGSEVLHLGTISAATEEEILKVNESIATVSNLFGLSAQATTALASALATLKVRPELARGSLTRVFGALTDAVKGSGDALESLSKTMGMSAADVKNLMNTDPDTFFLKFVEGLRNANENGTTFRESLRELDVNAVRDIDTFSRLGNNFDLVADSFTEGFASYAQGTELMRQSQGIIDTTKVAIQNLGDSFALFMSVIGTPLMHVLNAMAVGLNQAFEAFVNLNKATGGVLGIIGSVVLGVGALVTAFIGYRVILAKVIQAAIAYNELQSTMRGQALSLATAIQALTRNEEVEQIATTASARARTAQAEAMAASVAAAEAAAAAEGVVASATEASMTSLVARAAAQERVNTQLGLFAASEARVAQVTTAEAAATAAATEQLVLFEAETVSVAAAQAKMAATTAAAAETTTAASVAATAAAERTAVAANSLGVASRFASAALGPWGLALIVLGPLLLSAATGAGLFEDQAKKTADAAIEAAGGADALASAMKQDTQAAKDGGAVYREVATSKKDLSDADRHAAESAIADANARLLQISLIGGTVDQLRAQAKGQGAAAQAAKGYLAQIDEANKTIDHNTQLLGENTVVIGEQTAAWQRTAAAAILSKTGLDKNAGALDELKKRGINLGEVLNQALRDPEGAAKGLDGAIKGLNDTIRDGTNMYDLFGYTWTTVSKDAKNAKPVLETLESLQRVIRTQGDETKAAAAVQQLLSDAFGSTEDAARKSGEAAEATTVELNAMGDTADETAQKITELAGALTQIGTPLTAFNEAAEVWAKNTTKNADEAAKAIHNFSLSTKGGFAEYKKQLLDLLEAQANWSKNIVILSQRLGPEVASELAKLGPEAAPMLQQLVDLSKEKLDELAPLLKGSMTNSMEGLAAAILGAQEKLAGSSKETGTAVANALVAELNNPANLTKISDVIARYNKILDVMKEHKIEIPVEVAPTIKTLDDLEKYVNGLAFNAKGSVTMTVDDVYNQIARLKIWIADEQAAGHLDAVAKGNAQLDQLYAQLAQLQQYIQQQSKSGAYDPNGQAHVETGAYYGSLNSMSNTAQGWSRNGYFNVNGQARVSDGVYYDQLGAMTNKAQNTGAQITRALSVSANVYYTYKATNSPPDVRSLRAAGGGWVNGPGGPRDDKVPAMLSNGEFVVNAASASKYAALLEAINTAGGNGGAPFSTAPVVPGSGAWKQLEKGTDMAKLVGGSSAAPSGMAAGSIAAGAPVTQITVYNQYPQAEPTSTTINRSLALAATISGV